MPVDAKICGIRTPGALHAARMAGASHVGFVFFPKSPRNITLGEARGLSAAADGMMRVGLFVDADDDLLAAAAPMLDILQLHGGESPAHVQAVKSRHDRPIWKALGISTRADLRAAEAYRGAADMLLLDARPPEDSDRPGGCGVRFDWQLLKDARPDMPWGLAGGLTPENVAEAITATGAPLVDTSSGVEDAPGQKSAAKIAAFMEAVHSV
ncbi:phosphoribosylanthranilate isomerase [Pacificimonas sp. WHA3]|uniref:N-(5'-phosphoribosyl)anthranilate isomerase n=1 Tax=Pacificimonas pallii TaxID=2827236 RepID=A0ABS6SGP3_9SPHN|nr:phosphoribosylanthranilate isomerase [Pacificimonas pallii]MBV7257560.1 phosphoribosylanthranilate isomerase [Pacificimonas pallii]